MKILAVMPSYRQPDFESKVGGGEISNRMLLEGLASLGHKVKVLTWNSGNKGSGVYNGVSVIDLGKKNASILRHVGVLLLFSSKAKEIAKKFSPDVILCCSEGLAPALKIKTVIDAPLGTFVRAFENFVNVRSFYEYGRYLLKRSIIGGYGVKDLGRSDFLLPNSEFMDRFCKSEVPFSKSTFIIYPPLDFYKMNFPEIKSVKNISMVGTSEKKGICVAEYLAERFPDITFRVLGSGKAELEFRKKIENLKFLGWIDVKDEFENKSDAVIVPSLWQEPFGRVSIEALACGCPVFVSDIGGLPETVFQQKPLIIKTGDFDSWRNTIGDFVSNPNTYIEYAKCAASNLQKFSVRVQVKKLDTAIRAVVESKSV